MIGSLSNPIEKSNHVWKYVIFMVCHEKYVNGLYRDKVEKQYQTMNTRDALRNLKVIAGDVSTSQSARSNTPPEATV